MKCIISITQLILFLLAYDVMAARGWASDLSSFAVLAEESIHCGKGSEIVSGDLGVITSVSGTRHARKYEVIIDRGGYLHDGVTLYGDTVKIGAQGSIDTVYYNELENNGTIRGESHTPLQLPANIALPDFPEVLPGSSAIFLARNETRVLQPGHFGKIATRRNSTLILAGGTYHMENLQIGSGAHLYFRGATELLISKRFTANRDSSIMPEPGSNLGASDIYIYAKGINGYSGGRHAGPRAVKFGIDNIVAANVYAPNGTIQLKQGTRARGAFIGRDVIIGPRALVELESGFSEGSAPPASTWIGSGDSLSWHDPGNWLAHEIPGPEDQIIIPDLAGGTITLNAPVTIRSLAVHGESSLQIYSGSLQVLSDLTLNDSANLEISGGELSVSEKLTITKDAGLSWLGGSLISSETIINNGTFTIDDTGGQLTLDCPALLNEGVLNWISGDIVFLSRTEMSNRGSFTIVSDNILQSVLPGSVLYNHGMIARNGGEGTVDLDLDVHNFGVFDIQSGEIRFSGKNFINEQNGMIRGNGTIGYPGADLVNAGVISPGNSAGELIFHGGLFQTASGILRMQVSGASFDHIVFTGSCNLGGTLDVSIGEGDQVPAGESLVMGTCIGGISGYFDTVITPYSPPGQDALITVNAENMIYDTKQLYTLAVNKSGSGAGTVASSDSSINCGPVCEGIYVDGFDLTLDAAASSGSAFLGWSGACSGTAQCSIHIGSDLSVSALFGQKVVVPDVVGMDLGSAEATITSAGLQVGGVDYVYRETVPQGQIYNQNPAPGTEVSEYADVNLQISGQDPAAPHIGAEPLIVDAGEAATLTWSIGLALFCSITPDIGPVQHEGSQTVTPVTTTTYTFSCSDPEIGDFSADVTVMVNGSLGAKISAEPMSVFQGESTALDWISTGALSCSIAPDLGNVPCIGSRTVSPGSTTTYTLTATGESGSVTSDVTVAVDTPAPVIDFHGVATEIKPGEPVELNWQAAHADTCSIDNGIGPVECPGGSVMVFPAASTTYTLTATGPGGTNSVSVAVSVNNQPVVILGGLVFDETTGLPVQNATVTVLDSDKSQSVNALADGSYQVVGIAPGNADITVAAPGYVARTLYYTYPAGIFSLDIMLYPEGTPASVSGTVISARTLLPEPGVGITDQESGASTVTDAAGNFTLSLELGIHTVRILKEGFADEFSIIEVDEPVVEVEIIAPINFVNGQPESIDMDITGYVYDAVSGAPLAGAVVKTYQHDFETTTDGNGMYSFTGLPLGIVQFISMAVGHEAVVATVTVNQGSSSSLDMPLQPLTKGYITGSITDESTGLPVQNVTVSNGAASLLAADSEAGGTYTLVGVPAGIYSLTASHPEYLPATVDNIAVFDQEGTLLDLTLVHKPVTGTLEGTLRDKESSMPIAGARISLADSMLAAITDSNGYYCLPDMPAGLVTLAIEAPGYPSTVRITAVTADEDFATPTVTIADFLLDSLDPAPPASVSVLMPAAAGGVIESFDKQFKFYIPPDALTGDAILTLMPADRQTAISAGDILQTDPDLGVGEVTALGSGIMLVIEPAVAGDPIPNISGYVAISGRFSQAEADRFNIVEDSVFPYFWDGANWTAMRIINHENAVDRINNIPFVTVDFSTSMDGKPITAGINLKERVMVAALADHIPDLEFARKPFFFFGGVLGGALPVSPNVKIYYSDELKAVNRFDNLPPDDPLYRHKVLENGLPLLFFHGWSPWSILRGTGWVDPNKDERYQPILDDLTEATCGVYRPVFVTYNTRSRMKSVGARVAEMLHGKDLGWETVAGLGPERQVMQFPYHDTMGFSKGGLIARNYLAYSNKPGSMVTIATPHHGTVRAAQDIATVLGPAGIAIDNGIKTWSPGTADLLDYNDEAGSLISANRQLSILNKNQRSFPSAGDLTLIAGTDSDSFIGQNLLPQPNDRVVPAESVFGRTTSVDDPQFASLLHVQEPWQYFKYEYMFPFSHYNFGTVDFRIKDYSGLKDAITNGLSDWAAGRHIYGEQNETTDDSPYIEWVKYTVEVEYNVLDPVQHDTNCGLAATDCCAANREYCADNNGSGRKVRRLDRVALVVYALDEEGNWHLAAGAAADGSRALTDARTIKGNSLVTQAAQPLRFDYQDITFFPEQKIVGTTYLLLKLEPGENTAPATPEGGGLGALL